MKKFILALILVSHSYICQPGDTLDLVARKYYNNSNPAGFAEFKEGIRENNYDVLGNKEIWVGLRLKINRWE